MLERAVCIIFFDVGTELKNNILKWSDPKYTYEIETLQIDFHILQSSNILFSKRDPILNHICIETTLYDKHTKSNNHILQ